MGLNIVKEEIIEKDGVQWNKKTTDKGYTIEERIPTAQEMDYADYQTERRNTLDDIRKIEEDILLEEATLADKTSRLAEWNTLKVERGWDSY